MTDWIIITLCVALMVVLNAMWVVAYQRVVRDASRLLEKAQTERWDILSEAIEERELLLKEAARERGLLMDRIQSKDLHEYKTLTREVTPIEPKTPAEIITPI